MKIGSETPVIVAGGASGLGEATAREFAARGAPAAILDRDVDRGQAIAAEIGGAFFAIDVTDDASVDAALSMARATQGPERVCVNCAGIAPAARIVSRDGPHDMALFAKVVDVNLVGSMRVMSRSAAAMVGLERFADGERGVIINTASVAAYEGQVGQAAYAASKGGVASLTLTAARDLAQSGVRVNAVAPGVFETAMLRGLPDDVRSSLAEQVPFPPRLGQPAEFADLICFLVETPYMNGEVVRIDGAIRMGAR